MPFEPRIGDRLLSINGLPVEGFLERSKRYIASSTLERLWLELAVNASVQRVDFGPELYQGEVTKGNLRISDVTARLVAQLSDRDDADPANGRLLDWRRTDVSKAMEQGRSYTRPVSFRLRALPRTSDGVWRRRRSTSRAGLWRSSGRSDAPKSRCSREPRAAGGAVACDPRQLRTYSEEALARALRHLEATRAVEDLADPR